MFCLFDLYFCTILWPSRNVGAAIYLNSIADSYEKLDLITKENMSLITI